MICENTSVKFCCEDISKIENYEQAMKDETQTWDCHHRAEILPCGNFTRDALNKFGLYYNRPSSELIFLTRSEHNRLHKSGERHHYFGKHLSEEHRRKLSEAKKGDKNSLFGKKHSDDTKRKISAAMKGKPHPHKGVSKSEDVKRKISEANKGNKYRLGHIHSEESRRKMSEARKAYLARMRIQRG